MVPRLVHGIAGNPGGMPGLACIVPDVPLMASRNPAFVSPDKGLAIDELVDVKLQRLRNGYVVAVKVDVINEIVSGRINGSAGVRLALR